MGAITLQQSERIIDAILARGREMNCRPLSVIVTEPGAKVAVLINGVAMIEVDATPAGEFVALFTLPPNDQPSLMSLAMTLADGRTVRSQHS